MPHSVRPEAQGLAAIRHPGVVGVYAFGSPRRHRLHGDGARLRRHPRAPSRAPRGRGSAARRAPRRARRHRRRSRRDSSRRHLARRRQAGEHPALRERARRPHRPRARPRGVRAGRRHRRGHARVHGARDHHRRSSRTPAGTSSTSTRSACSPTACSPDGSPSMPTTRSISFSCTPTSTRRSSRRSRCPASPQRARRRRSSPRSPPSGPSPMDARRLAAPRREGRARARETPAASAPLTVLIVDDDADIGRLVAMYVKQAAPTAEITVARDAQQALDAFRKKPAASRLPRSHDAEDERLRALHLPARRPPRRRVDRRRDERGRLADRRAAHAGARRARLHPEGPRAPRSRDAHRGACSRRPNSVAAC